MNYLPEAANKVSFGYNNYDDGLRI